mgnify:CR=1 FL=1
MKYKENVTKFKGEDIKNGKYISILSYIWILAFIPFLTSNNKYVLYHSKQGIRLSIIYTVLLIIFIPLNKIHLFWRITDILIPLIVIFALVFSLIGIYDVIKGKAKPLPLINKIFNIKK